MRVDTRDAIVSLKALDAQSDLTDQKLKRVGNSLDSIGSGSMSRQIDQTAQSFKRLDSGLLVSAGHIEDTSNKAKTLGNEIDTVGSKTKKAADDTKTHTESMSKSWNKLSQDTKNQMRSMGNIISDLANQRKAAANEIDKALLDQKLAVAKSQLRDLARDSAWSQLKSEAQGVGNAFDRAANSIGGGGGGGSGRSIAGGGSSGGGGFLGGISAVIKNVPTMGAVMLAALPAVSSFTGALVALVGSAAQAGAGLGALGIGSAGALGVGGISTLVEGKQVASGIQASMKSLAAYQKAVQASGAQSTSAQTAQRNLLATTNRTGTTLPELQALQQFQQGFRQQTQPGRQALTQSLFGGIGDFSKVESQITGMMNADTKASANALSGAFQTLTSPGVLHSLDSLSGTFQQIVKPGVNTGLNLLKTFLNVAVAAEPRVVKMFDSLDTWSGHLASSTSNTDKLSGKVGHLVDQFKAWEGLLKSGGKLIFDLFNSGAPQGQSMVTSITHTFDKWDAWIKTHPAQMHDFFQTAIHDAGSFVSVLGELVKLLAHLASDLQPVLGMIGDITKTLSQSGLLGPLLTSGAAAYLLRGGAGGKLISPLSYMLNPAAGAARTAGVAAGRMGGGGTAGPIIAGGLGGGAARSGLRGAASGLGSTFSETRALAQSFGYGGAASVGAGLGASAYGALGALPGVLGNAAGAAAKFLGPLMIIQGVFGAASTPGNIWNRLAGGLHTASFGLIPADGQSPVSAKARQGVGAQADLFLARSGPTDVVRRYSNLSRLEAQYSANPNVSDAQAARQAGMTPQFAASIYKGLGQGGFGGNAGQFLDKLRPQLTQSVDALIGDLGKRFKFYSEPAMFKQLNTWISALPPQTQVAGAKAMEALAVSLEKQGKLPKGAAQRLIKEINNEFPQLSKDFIRGGTNSMAALANTIRDDKARTRISKDIQAAVNPFQQLSALQGVKLSAKNVGTVWEQAMDGLTHLMNTGPKAQREAAKKAYDQLAKDSGIVTTTVHDDFKNMTDSSSGFFGNLTKTIFSETGKEVGYITSMDDSVGKGLKSVMTQTANAIKALGGNVSSGISNLASGVVNNVFGVSTASNAGAGHKKAMGGRLPGEPKGDHLPLYGKGGNLLGIADGGELVVNRHTEARIAAKYGVNLGAEVAQEYRAHNAPMRAHGGRLGVPHLATGGNVWRVRTSQEASSSGAGWTELSNNGNAASYLGIPRTASGSGGWDFASLGRAYPRGTMLTIKSEQTGKAATAPETDVGDGSSFAPAIGITPGLASRLGGFPSTVQISMADGSDIHPRYARMASLVSGTGGLSGGGIGGAAGVTAPTIKQPVITGPKGALLDIASLSMKNATAAAQKKVNASVPATPAGGIGGAASVGSPGGPTGVGTYKGLQMANWVIESLHHAESKGITPTPTSGYRPGFDPHTASGHSEHSGTQYPHGAVDFGGYNTGLGMKMSVVNATRDFKWPLLAPIGFHDDGHASGTGHTFGGRLPGGFAGWYKDGGSFSVNKPTLFGAGEGGQTEHVQITPGGKSGRDIVIHNIKVENHREGDIKRMILAELEQVSEALADGHVHNPADLLS